MFTDLENFLLSYAFDPMFGYRDPSGETDSPTGSFGLLVLDDTSSMVRDLVDSGLILDDPDQLAKDASHRVFVVQQGSTGALSWSEYEANEAGIRQGLDEYRLLDAEYASWLTEGQCADLDCDNEADPVTGYCWDHDSDSEETDNT